jgi:hypothetical protein
LVATSRISTPGEGPRIGGFHTTATGSTARAGRGHHSVGNARMARQSSSNTTKKCELFSSGFFFKTYQRWRFTSARSICNVVSTNLPHPNVGRRRCSI